MSPASPELMHHLVEMSFGNAVMLRDLAIVTNRSYAKQPSVFPPLVPWHCQMKAEPSDVTVVGVPALHKLVVGGLGTVVLLAEPQRPSLVVMPLDDPVLVPELELLDDVSPELELVEPEVVPNCSCLAGSGTARRTGARRRVPVSTMPCIRRGAAIAACAAP